MAFSKFWNKSIWRLLRPTNLVQSVVSSVRLATDRLSSLANLADHKPTIATGKQYNVVSIPLTHITEIVEQLDEDTEITRYKVIGLPRGVVTVGKSPDGATALRYVDFTEAADGYVFRAQPTNYGVVSGRGGAHCTFCVCIGSASYLEDQDTANLFCRALDDRTVACLTDKMTSLSAVNGLSGDVLALACGATTASAEGSVTTFWSEGIDLFALVNDELLVFRGRAKESPTQTLEKGEALVSRYADFVVFADQKTHKAVWFDKDTDIANIPAYVHESVPESAYIDDVDTLASLINSKGQYTCDTTNSPNDPGTQRLLRKYRTTAPYLHLTQRLELESIGSLADAEQIALICADSIDAEVARRPNESALSYLLRCARSGSVAVISDVHKQETKLYAMSTYAKYLTKKPTAGTYIHAVVVLGAEKNGNPGVILDEIRVKPTTVKSGESIAIKITNDKE